MFYPPCTRVKDSRLVLYTVYSLNEPGRHKFYFICHGQNRVRVVEWLCTKWQCSLGFDVPYLNSTVLSVFLSPPTREQSGMSNLLEIFIYGPTAPS
jgi:hypothetical protein